MAKYGTGLLDKAARGMSTRKQNIDSAVEKASGPRVQAPASQAPRKPIKKKRTPQVVRKGNSFSHGQN